MNRYETAARINREVNESVSYRTDAAQYGRPEHWECAGAFGDCEDYALLKRAKLLDAGWDTDRLGLVTCKAGGVGHCVLWVDTNDGSFILDNIHHEPRTPSLLDYEWEAMLCGGQWRQLRGWS